TLGGNGITLGNFGTGAFNVSIGDITNNSLLAQTVNLPVALSPGKHLIVTGAGPLNLTAPITRVTGAVMNFNTGASSINVAGSGLANDASGIIGAFATVGGNATTAGNWASVGTGTLAGQIVPYANYIDIAGGGSI